MDTFVSKTVARPTSDGQHKGFIDNNLALVEDTGLEPVTFWLPATATTLTNACGRYRLVIFANDSVTLTRWQESSRISDA